MRAVTLYDSYDIVLGYNFVLTSQDSVDSMICLTGALRMDRR